MKQYVLYFSLLAVMALGLSLTGCDKNKEKEEPGHEPYVLYKFADNPYLAEVWWGDDYDPDYANEFYCNKYNQPKSGGACSSWHKDNFHGRNQDWMMYGFATIIAHTPRSSKVKYASVSLMTGNPALDRAFVENNETIPDDMRKYVVATAVDGINECGVTINHNVVPYDGKTAEQNGDITTISIVRLVLDNCATADEAADLLEKKAVTQALAGVGDYSHFHISDPNSSYVIEWRGKKFHKTKYVSDNKGNFISEKGQNSIMTNYLVFEAEEHGLGTKEFFRCHPEAAGVERTRIIDQMLPAAKTVEDHLNICKAVWYRQFCKGQTDWATENAGSYGYDETSGKCWWTLDNNVHWLDTDDVYETAKAMLASDEMKDYFNYFNNSCSTLLSPTNAYWYTQQSIVYDLAAKKGYLIMQEGMFSNKVIEFGIE